MGEGPLPSCLFSWLPVKSQSWDPRGLQLLALFQEQLATSLGGGLRGRVARPLEAGTLLHLWPAGLPQALGWGPHCQWRGGRVLGKAISISVLYDSLKP